MPPIEPPNPTSPATEPTLDRGNRSAGSTMTTVDQDCCPKKAMLKSTMAKCTGTCVTSKMQGITDTLSPSVSLREKLREWPRRISHPENHPPTRQPTPAQA